MKVGCCLVAAVTAVAVQAGEYYAETEATAWSGILEGDWTPSAFVLDVASTATVTTAASSFAFDTALTADQLCIRSGGQDLSVTMSVKPTVRRMAFDGANGKIVFGNGLPSVLGLTFDGAVDVGGTEKPATGGQSITVIGGTTTFTRNALISVENINFSITVKDGVVQTAGNGHLYTGHNSGTRTYDILGGKFACALTIPNKDSRGIRINVSGGEFAPPFIQYHQGGSGIGDYSGTAMDIRLSDGLFAVPPTLPDWAPVSVKGDAQIRGAGHSVVHSVLTIDEGCTLSAAPSEANTSLAFAKDIQGRGTFAVANDLTWRLISTNHLEGAMRFVTGKKLTLDTSMLEAEEGAIIADVGFIFPEGKSLADIDEFVTLSNPYAYELLVIDAGTLAVCSRGAITYTAHIDASKWSEIEDSAWDPFAYVHDASSIARVYSTASAFAFDTAVVGDDVRFINDSGAAASVTFTASPKVKTLTLDGSNGLVNVTSALPAGIPKLQFCGETSISIEKPWLDWCASFDVMGGTMTLNGNGTLFNVENQPFTINVRGGLLQNKAGVRIYTGFTGGNHQYFNVYGGKMTSRLAVANYKARGTHVNVYGGEFAPTAINYHSSTEGDWRVDSNGVAVPIRLMGGVFSVPSILPAWAEIEAVSNATVRAQGDASVYSTVKVDADATLTVADSENGGLLTLLNLSAAVERAGC